MQKINPPRYLSSPINEIDDYWMKLALEQAQKAFELNEVPIGAVLVSDALPNGFVPGHNLKEQILDPTSHAEINVLKTASSSLHRWRLNDCTLYVTLEPCFMCAGALVNARIKRLVVGCLDPKAGAVVSLSQVCTDPRLNHAIDVEYGVQEKKCAEILRKFFQLRRR